MKPKGEDCSLRQAHAGEGRSGNGVNFRFPGVRLREGGAVPITDKAGGGD